MHTPILAYTFIGFCILLSLEDPPFFGRYMVGFLIQRPLEATVLTASLTHGAATAPEGKAQLEALLYFLGQCRESNWRHGGVSGHLESWEFQCNRPLLSWGLYVKEAKAGLSGLSLWEKIRDNGICR